MNIEDILADKEMYFLQITISQRMKNYTNFFG